MKLKHILSIFALTLHGVFIYSAVFVYEIPSWLFIPLFFGVTFENLSRRIATQEKITKISDRLIDFYGIKLKEDDE